MRTGFVAAYRSRQVVTFGRFRQDDSVSLVDASGCLDAPQFLPGGAVYEAVAYEPVQRLVKRPC